MAIKSSHAALVKQIKDIQQERRKIVAELDGVQDRIEALENEQSNLRGAVVSKAEFVEGLCGYVSALADRARDDLHDSLFAHTDTVRSRSLRFHASRSSFGAEKVKALVKGQISDAGLDVPGLVAGFNPLNQNGHLFLHNLCMMLEEPIKAGIRANFDKIDWPYDDGLAAADRERRMAEIDAELLDLKKRESELLTVVEETRVPL